MYECDKQIFHSTYKHACNAKDIPSSKTEELVTEYKCDYEDMIQRIKGHHKCSEIWAAGSKQSTVDFEDTVNITVNNARVIPDEKSGDEEDHEINPCDGIEDNKRNE